MREPQLKQRNAGQVNRNDWNVKKWEGKEKDKRKLDAGWGRIQRCRKKTDEEEEEEEGRKDPADRLGREEVLIIKNEVKSPFSGFSSISVFTRSSVILLSSALCRNLIS